MSDPGCDRKMSYDAVMKPRDPDHPYPNPSSRKPAAQDWAWLDEVAGKLDSDMVDAVLEAVDQQERPELETLFLDMQSSTSD